MNKWSLKTLRLIRDITIVVGILGGLIVWFRVPSMISNSLFLHVGNGKYGSKIGMLILLILPLSSLLVGREQNEIHVDNENERARLERERKISTVKTQICYAIGEAILVLGLMIAGILF